jgi:hypothetical protein
MKFLTLLPLIFFLSCSVSNAAEFSISSSDLKNGNTISEKHVFEGFGCKGQNISPQISWNSAPKETKNFALTVYDPDAPTGSGWWHWLVLNIPASYEKLPQNFGAQKGFRLKRDILQIRNDYGIFGFGGPCPPQGDKPHRYIFTIYALKAPIDLNYTASAALAGFMINQNTIAKSSFEATYGR